MNRMRELRIEKGITMREAAEKLNLPYTTYVNYEKNAREPNSEILIEIADFYNTSIDYLLCRSNVRVDDHVLDIVNTIDNDILEQTGNLRDAIRLQNERNVSGINRLGLLPINSHRRVPILGSAACGEPIYDPAYGTETVSVEDDLACDFALTAKGDSMIGDRIQSGDVVFFRKQEEVDDGDVVAVVIDDEVMIKHISRVRDTSGTVIYTLFLSSNPKYTPISVGGENETRAVRILGKAIAFRSLM